MNRILAENFYWKSVFASHLVEHWTLVLQLMQGCSAVIFCMQLGMISWAESMPSLADDEICSKTEDGHEGERGSDANACLRSGGQTTW